MKAGIPIIFTIAMLIGCGAGKPDIPVSHSVDDFEVETVVEGIDVPWGMTWLPNGDMIITNRAGTLHRFSEGQLYDITGVPEVHANGQGGLLDVEIHPNYEENGWLYLTYSSLDGGGEGSNTALMRAQLEGNTLIEKEVLYKAEPNTGRGVHYGSRIEFDRDGYLYFTIGDRGNRDVNPQDLSRDGGKVYRLNDDGSIPEDNPYVDDEGAISAIYSYGHRNPQGMAMNPNSGDIWTHEHGPRGGDEVNIIRPADNYGWPVISYGINYNGTEFAEDTARAGMEQPVWYWDPSIAPSGMTFVTSDKYPGWNGDLIVGSLKFAYLVLCDVEGNEIVGEEILFEGIGRVRNVKQGPDGYIYVATEGSGIKRIVPKSS